MNINALNKMALSVGANNNNLPLQQKNKLKQRSSEDKTNKILYALGGIAASGLAAVLIYNKAKKGRLGYSSSSLETKNNSVYSIESIEKNIDNLSQELKSVLNNKMQKLKLTKYDFINVLQEKEKTILPLDYVFKLKENKIQNVPPIPSILYLQNVPNEKAKNISEILSTRYGSEVVSTRYTKNYINEFMESLKEFSLPKQSGKHKFINIGNPNEFLTDLKLESNKSLFEKFQELLKRNTKNNVTYVMNENPEAILSSNKITLAFDDNIKNLDLTNDLNDFAHKINLRDLTNLSNLREELSLYIDGSTKNADILLSLIKRGKKDNAVLIKNGNSLLVNKVFNKIKEKTGDNIKQIDCSKYSLDELYNLINRELPKTEDLYNRTGEKTFLYLENLEKNLSENTYHSEQLTNFSKIINTAGEKHNTILIVNTHNEFSKLQELFTDKMPQLILRKHADYYEKLLPIKNAVIEKMKTQNFNYLDKDIFMRDFIEPLMLEKLGFNSSQLIPNGILLYGEKSKTATTIEAITNTLDCKFKDITYDPQKPDKMFEELSNIADEAISLFEKENVRTILSIEKLDELLTSFDKKESRRLIGKFKNFIENSAENNKLTIIMQTDKPLESFEAASIGSQRFNLQMKAK